MKAEKILIQEYGTYSWRKALAYTKPAQTYSSPEEYVAAVRRYCGQQLADFRLIAVGFRRWPLSLWKRATEDAESEEDIPRLRDPRAWLDFWEETQPRPDVVGSSYNGDPNDVFNVWCHGVTSDKFDSLRKGVEDGWVAWRIIARLIHRRDIPVSRLVTRAIQIARVDRRADYWLAMKKGELVRIMKAPYRVFWCAIVAPQGPSLIWDGGVSRVDWAETARRVREIPAHEYPKKYLWATQQRYVPGALLLLSVPAHLIAGIDKKWLMKMISHGKVLAQETGEDDPARHPTTLRGIVALSLIWPKGDNRGTAWLDYQVRHRGCTVHDAVLHLPLPESPQEEEDEAAAFMPGFGRWLSRHKDTDLQLVGVVAAGWATATSDERKMPVRELVASIRARGYSETAHAAFAAECAQWGVSDQDYPKLERRWLDAVRAGQGKQIPLVKVVLPDVKYHLSSLPQSDPRALWLGQHTYCCQSVGGAAESSAWHGVSSPDSGFWIVTNEAGEIVAQSWVWATNAAPSRRVLVIDSIEKVGNGYEGIDRLYRAAAEQAVSVHTEKSVDEVRLGRGSGLRLSGLENAEPGKSVDPPPGVYTDAREQDLLARRPVISIDRIKKIERQAYAGADHMCQLQACQTLQDVAAYCEVETEDVTILGEPGGSWYAIVAIAEDGSGEWVDAAKLPKTPFPHKKVLEDLRRRGAKRLRVDARGKTAWKVLQSRGSELGVTFTEEETWDWSGERMHAGLIDLCPA